MPPRTLYYDGDCGFCNATVAFVLRHEREPSLRFAPLQSGQARAQLRRFGIAADDLSSMLLVDGDALYRESEAAVRIAACLDRPWSWLRFLRWVPRTVRDAAYRLIGRHRHRWPGGRTACVIPDAGMRRRMAPRRRSRAPRT